MVVIDSGRVLPTTICGREVAMLEKVVVIEVVIGPKGP
jgi:hypothetical protein